MAIIRYRAARMHVQTLVQHLFGESWGTGPSLLISGVLVATLSNCQSLLELMARDPIRLDQLIEGTGGSSYLDRRDGASCRQFPEPGRRSGPACKNRGAWQRHLVHDAIVPEYVSSTTHEEV